MEVGNILFYRKRWKAIEAGMQRDDDEGEMEVFLRWAKIKAKYEAG